MAVNTELLGNHNTAEYKAGQALKAIFDDELRDKASGHIVILCGVTLFGQATKDVDLVIYGDVKDLKHKFKFRNNNNEMQFDTVYIDNFCMCIEVKQHEARDVKLDGLVLKVRYNGKPHDVTHQSEKQKYALANFLEDRTKRRAPYIYNFIWLTEVPRKSLFILLGDDDSAKTRHNYLPSTFSLKWLFQLAAVQKRPYKDLQRNCYVCNSLSKNNNIHEYDICSALSLLTEMRQTMGDLTRKKLEKISQRLIHDQSYAKSIGKELLVVAGRAGTGKTVKLIRLAYDLAINHGKRCLILTYNQALVSDIKRMLALSGMPDGVDVYSVNIETLHKFFYELAIGLGFGKESWKGKKYIDDFLLNYRSYLADINEFIKEGVIEKKDIENLMVSRHDEIAWDFVLVDEAQDWNSSERDLIYKIFTPSKVIIADGMDQMVRSQQHCNWAYNVDHYRVYEKRCLRQKRNLVEFVNQYAEEFDLGWALEPIQEYEGGKVIISAAPTPYGLFRREFEVCEQYGNRAYEMMFLTPPVLVQRQAKTANGEKTSRRFVMTEEFLKEGFKLWDGTRQDLRSNYPTDVNEYRLFQYDSCRGLECWTVVCLQLDEFVRYKTRTYKDEGGQKTLFQETAQDCKERYVHLWSLIPLTRAIDTIVITLRNPKSDYAARLRALSEKMPDFVEWTK